MQTRIRDLARERYHSLALSSIWELDRIRAARALIVGAGALGNEVAKNLAMMGVRRITLVDPDTVEVANLTRSIFFREHDHGRSKVETLAERLREFNSDVEVVPLCGAVEEIVGHGLLRDMDLIFSCLDNRFARRNVNRMCQRMAKPWVDGAMENLLGDVTPYLPDDGPCYECTLTPNDLTILAERVSCRGLALDNVAQGKVPTVSTMGSIIGALQVQEALKILHGVLRPSAAGSRLVVNCQTNDVYATTMDRRDQCPGHFRFGPITEIAEASHNTTSANDLLEHFRIDSSDEGHLRLGREIVVGLRCHRCSTSERMSTPLSSVSVERALCPNCGGLRELETTHVVRGSEDYALWPLAQLGIPALEVLEIRGARACRWYELSGDRSPSGPSPRPDLPASEAARRGRSLL